MNIEIPRDNPKNEGVCKDIETFVFDTLTNDPDGAYHLKDLTRMAVKRFALKYGDNLTYHVVRALDQFFANRLIKRVAPSVFQSVDGPDDEYSERASGFVPEGLGYQPRPANYTNCPTVPSARARAIFNADVRKAETSINILKRSEMSLDEIQDKLIFEGANFNPVAVKFAIRQLRD